MSCGTGAPCRAWLDCDPGHDDALAIILASSHSSLRLTGVSTLACNQSLEKTTANALATLYAIGKEHIPVHQGQAKPLMREAPLCVEIHGETGLDAPEGGRLFPDSPVACAPTKAVLAIAEAIKAAADAGERFHLICTGALSNAALLLLLYPELLDKLSITIMGGAMGIGNTGPVQEFNIQTDPEAARIVFESGVDLTMVPLEVTHSMLATPDVIATLQDMNTPFGARIVDLLHFFASTYREVFSFEHPPVHDPVAVAYVCDPHIFSTKLMRVDIEVASSLCAGQTVCDTWQQSSKAKNVNVALSVDVGACWRLILDAVEDCNKSSPLNT